MCLGCGSLRNALAAFTSKCCMAVLCEASPANAAWRCLSLQRLAATIGGLQLPFLRPLLCGQCATSVLFACCCHRLEMQQQRCGLFAYLCRRFVQPCVVLRGKCFLLVCLSVVGNVVASVRNICETIPSRPVQPPADASRTCSRVKVTNPQEAG